MLNLILAIMISVSALAQNNPQTITGNVTDNKRPCGYIKADDGKDYQIHLGPYWYWEENKYTLELGSATIKGDIDGSDIYPYEITQNGKSMVFTDEKGNPKWFDGKCPGPGNGKGNGYGRGNGRGNCWRNK